MSQTVVITGADNGIGYHTAASLLQAGYMIAAFDLSGENLSVLAAQYPEALAYFHCDITSGQMVEEAVGKVIDRWGSIDILVNNACLAVFNEFPDKNLDDTRQEFEVNYFGTVRLIKAVLPHMLAKGKGLIHNVSSGVGTTGFPGHIGYVVNPTEFISRIK